MPAGGRTQGPETARSSGYGRGQWAQKTPEEKGSTLRRIEEGLQTFAEFVRQPRGPRGIDQSDFDEIAQGRAILIAESCKFDADERLERQHTKRSGYR